MKPIFYRKYDKMTFEVYPIGNLQANCAIITLDETKDALIFDPGNDSNALMSIIEENGLKVQKLIHTHAHFDHIGQTTNVQIATKAKTYLHKDGLSLYQAMRHSALLFGQEVSKNPRPIDYTFSEGDTIGFDSNEFANLFKIIHTPGHSPCGSCFYTDYFEKPLVIVGDTLFQGSIGRTDLPGGDYNLLISSIKQKLFVLPDTTDVITGHGPCTTLEIEKKYNPFLAN